MRSLANATADFSYFSFFREKRSLSLKEKPLQLDKESVGKKINNWCLKPVLNREKGLFMKLESSV